MWDALEGYGVRKRMSLCRIGAAAPLIAVLFGCSSSAAGQPSVAQVAENPCAYVSASDVTPAVGGPVNDGDLGYAGGNWNGAAVCVFTALERFVVAIPGANVAFESATIGFLDPTTWQTLATPAPPIRGGNRVGGFGDEAFAVVGPHYEVLFVRAGTFNVFFEVNAGKGSFLLPEERLARIVVPRLPA